MAFLRKIFIGSLSFYYALIGLEIAIMISPFAAYFYSVYAPVLNLLLKGHEVLDTGVMRIPQFYVDLDSKGAILKVMKTLPYIAWGRLPIPSPKLLLLFSLTNR